MQPGPAQQDPNPFKPSSENDALLRKTILSNRIMLSIPIVIILISLILMTVHLGAICFGFFAALFSCFFVYMKIYYTQEKFTLKFRETIVQNIIRAKDPSINYEPKSYFIVKEILSSGLLERMPNIYEGENYFEQKTPNYTMEVAWAYAIKQSLRNSIGYRGIQRQSTSSDIMLHGLVYKFTLPKRFSTNIIIRQDKGKGFWGSSSDNPDALYGDFRAITIDDQEFEKEFEVYTLNETEAKKIIDENMIKFFMYVKNYYKAKVQISFLGNYLYMTIQTEKKYFKPGFILSKNNASVSQVGYDAQAIFFLPIVIEPILKKYTNQA